MSETYPFLSLSWESEFMVQRSSEIPRVLQPDCILQLLGDLLLFVLKLFYHLVVPCGTWHPSSQTRDWTCATCIESTEPQPLDHKASPLRIFFFFFEDLYKLKLTMAPLFEIATLEWDRCIQIFLRLCFTQSELISISKGPKDFIFHEDGH